MEMTTKKLQVKHHDIDTEIIKMKNGYRWKAVVVWSTTIMSWRGDGYRRLIVDGQPKSGFAYEDEAITWANNMTDEQVEEAVAKIKGSTGSTWAMSPQEFESMDKYDAYMETCSKPFENRFMQGQNEKWLRR